MPRLTHVTWPDFGHPTVPAEPDLAEYTRRLAALRTDLALRFPDVATRVAACTDFMRRVIGMDVPDTLLPLADTCGIIAPYLFAPTDVLVL